MCLLDETHAHQVEQARLTDRIRRCHHRKDGQNTRQGQEDLLPPQDLRAGLEQRLLGRHHIRFRRPALDSNAVIPSRRSSATTSLPHPTKAACTCNQPLASPDDVPAAGEAHLPVPGRRHEAHQGGLILPALVRVHTDLGWCIIVGLDTAYLQLSRPDHDVILRIRR